MKPIMNVAAPRTQALRATVSDTTWRAIVNQTDDEIEIFLTGIVGDEWAGMDAGTIAQTLSANRNKRVTMRVNSFGGLAFDGLAIHNALAAHPSPTKAIIEGVAASAASLAAIGADTVEMYANATYHIHEGLGFSFGHIAQLQDTIEWLEAFNASAVKTYAAKTGVSIADMTEALTGDRGDGTVYSAEEALELGFVDAVIPLKDKAKAAADSRIAAQRQLGHTARYRLAQLRRRALERS